jgi:hypothetical protein
MLNECGVVYGMRSGTENRSARRKPAPFSLCPPQIPRDLIWNLTLAAAVGRRRLTASALSYDSADSKTSKLASSGI